MQSAAAQLENRAAEHEIKLVTPVLRAPVVGAWLRSRCRPDAQYPQGRVCSVYFDNREMVSLRAKINSDFLKRKVRVRCYIDPRSGQPLEPAFAEIKRKVGSRRGKQRVPLEGAAALVAMPSPSVAELQALLGPLRDAGHLAETDLQPFLRIRFDRLRFVEPTSGARVSLDSNVRGESVNPGLLPQRHPQALAHAVIEIKGPYDDLPRRLAGLRAIGCRRESFSKFARCYQKLARRSSF